MLVICCDCRKEYTFEDNAFERPGIGVIMKCPQCGTEHIVDFEPIGKKEQLVKPGAEKIEYLMLASTSSSSSSSISSSSSSSSSSSISISSSSSTVSTTITIIDAKFDYYTGYGNYLSSANNVKIGQSFIGNGGKLDAARIKLLTADGVLSGNITATIYTHSGTYGTSSVGTGAALATSDTVDSATITASPTWYEFNFSGANRITLTLDTPYIVAVEYSGGDADHRIIVTCDLTSDGVNPIHSGNQCGYISSWYLSGMETNDMDFYVFTVGGAETTTSSSSISTSISSSSSSSSTASISSSSSSTISSSTSSSSVSSSSTISTSSTLYPSATCVLDQVNTTQNAATALGKVTDPMSMVAQGFKPAYISEICAIQVRLAKEGSPIDNVVCSLYDDNAGIPGNKIVDATNTILGSSLPSSGWKVVEFGFAAGTVIMIDTPYWLVLSRSGAASDTNYYNVNYQQDGEVYVRGDAAYYDTSWHVVAGSDLWFGEFYDNTSIVTTSSSSSISISSSSSSSSSISNSSSSSSTITTSSTSTISSSSSSSSSTISSSSSSSSSSTISSSSSSSSSSTISSSSSSSSSSTISSSSSSSTISSSSSSSTSISSSSSSSTVSTSSTLPQDKTYSRGDYETLPANDNNLETAFDAAGYDLVFSNDTNRLSQTANNQYAIFEFKDKNLNNTDAITVTWDGQSSLAPSQSEVFLQIYNRSGAGSWTTIDSDNAESANTDFQLSAIVSVGLSDYYDINNIISCRVYQGTD